MSSVATGLFAGILLALVAAIGGFSMFLLAVVLGGIGVVVALVLDGRLDLSGVVAGRRRG